MGRWVGGVGRGKVSFALSSAACMGRHFPPTQRRHPSPPLIAGAQLEHSRRSMLRVVTTALTFSRERPLRTQTQFALVFFQENNDRGSLLNERY